MIVFARGQVPLLSLWLEHVLIIPTFLSESAEVVRERSNQCHDKLLGFAHIRIKIVPRCVADAVATNDNSAQVSKPSFSNARGILGGLLTNRASVISGITYLTGCTLEGRRRLGSCMRLSFLGSPQAEIDCARCKQMYPTRRMTD